LDATVFDWRQGEAANSARLVLRTNLSGTATSAEETVAIKLTYVRDAGARVDASATGGDVPQGQMVAVSTCVPPDLDQSHAVTSTSTCNSDGTGRTGGSITCPLPLQTTQLPN